MSRLTLTLDKALHSALRARAQADGGRSRSSVARAALAAYLKALKPTEPAPPPAATQPEAR